MRILLSTFLVCLAVFIIKDIGENIRDKTWILSLELKEQETGIQGAQILALGSLMPGLTWSPSLSP